MHSMVKCLKHTSTRFLHAEQGTVLPLFGLALFAILGCVGIAIDYGRAQMAQSKLHAAIDAAGLAAASVSSSRDVNSEILKFTRANFPQGSADSPGGYYMGVRYTIDPTRIDDNGVLAVNARGTVPTTFMQIFGKETVDIAAFTQITRGNTSMELVMSLDITGSMGGQKIIDLRNAANDLVDILYGDKETIDRFWVGIVPYATSVNIGRNKIEWLRDYNTASPPDSDTTKYPAGYPATQLKWKGCVESRSHYGTLYDTGEDMTDNPPTTAATKFPIYYWPSVSPNNPWTVSNLRQTLPYDNNNARGPNVNCGNEVTPLTSQKSTVKNRINQLQAWPRGGTMGSEGLAWGWRMISPQWRGMGWGHADNSLPLDYPAPENKNNKIVIMMTDGENNIYTNGATDYLGSDYTPYGFIQQRYLGAGVNTRARGITAVDAKFATTCERMKARGITLYTITFALNNATTQQLFRTCASKPEFYFNSPDGAALRQAFRQIADSLLTLRLSR